MNKTVLITGATSGIGKATATVFAKNNYNVIINYNSSYDKAISLSNELEEKYNISTLCIKADVSSEEEVKAMANKIKEKYSKIDVIVNNAGIAIDTTFEDKTVSNFKRILDVNLIGPFIVSKHLSKIMDEGSIVNVGSTNGIDSYYTYSLDYDASKAGLHILTKDLAVELSPKIRVNAVAPGWVNTEMTKDLEDNFRNEEESKIVLNRFAEPEEIAKVIYFLANEDASYINGSIIVVDGGRK